MEEILDYVEYRDGDIFWKRKYGTAHIKVGSPAGGVTSKGYRFFKLKRKRYLVHDVVFYIHNGYVAENVDHKDRNRLNNYPDNLRDSTTSQNNANKGSYSGSVSKYKGVNFIHRGNKGKKRWQARIAFKGKRQSLGYYHTDEDAARAYDVAAKKLHGAFAVLNFREES